MEIMRKPCWAWVSSSCIRALARARYPRMSNWPEALPIPPRASRPRRPYNSLCRSQAASPRRFLGRLFIGIQQFQFPPLLKANLTVPINSDGTFTFPSVPQGTYELVWSSDGTLHFYYASNGQQVLYTAHVGPLCPYNYGAINQTIPTTTTAGQ